MQKFILFIMIFNLVVGLPTPGYAQVTTPDRNIDQLITTGVEDQTIGVEDYPLGIRIGDTNTNVSDKSWLSQFKGGGLITNAVVSVFRYGTPAARVGWLLDAQNFGFDTNSPISVHGITSTNNVTLIGDIFVYAFRLANFTNTDGKEVRVCIRNGNTLVSCENTSDLQQPSLVVTRKNEVNTEVRYQIDWSAPGYIVCHALGGGGFFTGGVISGTDVSNPIKKGTDVDFTIACTNESGKMELQTKSIIVQ